jgi:hypothetical protein
MAGRADYNGAKFKEAVLYLSRQSAGDGGFGMVKLNKLLYRADFEAFRVVGHSITGATYERQDYGPVARELPLALDELAARGYLSWQIVGDEPYARKVPGADTEPDLSLFADDEIAVMDRALQELAAHGGKSASDWSHEESAGWRVHRNGETITYESGLIDSTPLDDERLAVLREYVSGLAA